MIGFFDLLARPIVSTEIEHLIIFHRHPGSSLSKRATASSRVHSLSAGLIFELLKTLAGGPGTRIGRPCGPNCFQRVKSNCMLGPQRHSKSLQAVGDAKDPRREFLYW